MVNKETWMKIADLMGQESKSNRFKVGAVVVKDDRIVSTGYNGTPPGWENCCEDEHGNTKQEVIHAELNAICAAAKNGISLSGGTMYTNLSPCVSCGLAISAAGIRAVHYRTAYRDLSGVQLLTDNGIEVEQLNVQQE